MVERNRMKIEKEKVYTLPKKHLFFIAKLNIDADYFIDKIIKGTQESKNNYATNVVGLMTSWDYFNGDKEFMKAILPIMDKMDRYKFIKPYQLHVAWGIAEGFGGRTRPHSHTPSHISAVLYLNDHHQELIFPGIDERVKPEPGKIVVFSSELTHRCDRNTTDKVKYAISMNFNETFEY